MKNLNELIPEVENYVTRILTKKLPKGLVYHNINHTLRVVKQAEIIGNYEELNEEEMNILRIAAWFHDVGYLKKYSGHEKASIKIATEFLKEKRVEPHVVDQIVKCIQATEIPQQPEDLISKVLCDADMMHMGMNQYFDIIKKLRKELKNMGVNSFSKKKFRKISIKTLANHKYHTNYCLGEISQIKEQNLKIMEYSNSQTANV